MMSNRINLSKKCFNNISLDYPQPVRLLGSRKDAALVNAFLAPIESLTKNANIAVLAYVVFPDWVYKVQVSRSPNGVICIMRA